MLEGHSSSLFQRCEQVCPFLCREILSPKLFTLQTPLKRFWNKRGFARCAETQETHGEMSPNIRMNSWEISYLCPVKRPGNWPTQQQWTSIAPNRGLEIILSERNQNFLEIGLILGQEVVEVIPEHLVTPLQEACQRNSEVHMKRLVLAKDGPSWASIIIVNTQDIFYFLSS